MDERKVKVRLPGRIATRHDPLHAGRTSSPGSARWDVYRGPSHRTGSLVTRPGCLLLSMPPPARASMNSSAKDRTWSLPIQPVVAPAEVGSTLFAKVPKMPLLDAGTFGTFFSRPVASR